MKVCGADIPFNNATLRAQLKSELKQIEDGLNSEDIKHEFNEIRGEAKAACAQQSEVAVDKDLRSGSADGAVVCLHCEKTSDTVDYSNQLEMLPAYTGNKPGGKHAVAQRLEAAVGQSEVLLKRQSRVIIMASGQSQYARDGQSAKVHVCMQVITASTSPPYKHMTMTAAQCEKELPAICEYAQENQPLLWLKLRGDTDSNAAEATYAHKLRFFQPAQPDHVYSISQATAGCRVAARQMHNRARIDADVRNPTMLEAWTWCSEVIALVNSTENQTIVPAIINYTRTDQQVQCGVNQRRNSAVEPATEPLPYGRCCLRIGKTLRAEAPMLFLAELTDLSSKALRMGEAFEAKRTADATAIFDVAWHSMAAVAQSAFNYCN
jgi:hypothetical protein